MLEFLPKRSLGQNFMIDKNVARKIIAHFNPGSDDIVLEIGPGKGILTEILLERVKILIAVEIDERLVNMLNERFSDSENFILIHNDILNIDLSQMAREYQKNLRIIGNIPYHITSPLLFSMFRSHNFIKDCMITVQKELARRITAAPGNKDYGILTVLSDLYSESKIMFYVSKKVFSPEPRVDSAVVRFIFRQILKERVENEQLFMDLVKICFNKRRKMIRNVLKNQSAFEIPQEVIKLYGLKRAEDLTISDYVKMANLIDIYMHRF